MMANVALIFAGSLGTWLGAVGILLIAAVLGTVILLSVSRYAERTQQRRAQLHRQFWALYAINDRLYHKMNQKRMNWSPERFKHHRFRWQSEP